MESYEKKADENLIALKRKDERNMTKNAVISILFSVALFIGIMVCLICNIAISGSITWSLIPVSSMVFVWLICSPGMMLGKRGILASLVSLSVFIIPYLFLLSGFVKRREVFSIGTAMAAASVIFLWIIAAVFYCMGKTSKLFALGTTFLLAIPFSFIINVILSNMIEEPVFDVWDLATVLLLLVLAFVSFICARARKAGCDEKDIKRHRTKV